MKTVFLLSLFFVFLNTSKNLDTQENERGSTDNESILEELSAFKDSDTQSILEEIPFRSDENILNFRPYIDSEIEVEVLPYENGESKDISSENGNGGREAEPLLAAEDPKMQEKGAKGNKKKEDNGIKKIKSRFNASSCSLS